MTVFTVTRESFLQDRQGRTFSDVAGDSDAPFDAILEFFNDESRQRRMEESETHHDRPALAGVVRELESLPRVEEFLSSPRPQPTKRLRQAIGVLVRVIMEGRGWKKTGKKGSLGVRGKRAASARAPAVRHNTGGLALWFLRAERYERLEGPVFASVRERSRRVGRRAGKRSPASK